MDLKLEFIQEMESILGAEATEFFGALELPVVRALRVNGLKAVALPGEWLVNPVPWCGDGYFVDEGWGVSRHPFHDGGAYYFQDASAMAVVEVLGVVPGDRVLDLCAAPGGKSTQVLSRLRGEGLLVSNEYHAARANVLAQNLERWGATNSIVVNNSAAELVKQFGAYFNKIVVDAPCSGSGMFRKDHFAREQWSMKLVHQCAVLQQVLLSEAVKLLLPGGTLVYSTCSFSKLENEDNVQWLLGEFPHLTLVKSELAGYFAKGVDGSDCLRLWPHHGHGEGHFIAVMKDMRETDIVRYSAQVMPKPVAPIMSLASQSYPMDWCHSWQLINGWWHGCRYQVDCGKLKVIRYGIPLGQQVKERIELHHSLALIAQTPINPIALNDQEVIEYLLGNTLPTTHHDGWVVISYQGLALGWGKVVQGMIKNYYPKGLRWQGLVKDLTLRIRSHHAK